MVEPAIFGPIDTLFAPVIGYIVLILVILNLITRYFAHEQYVTQAEEGADAISRHSFHEATNVLVVVASFYYLTVHHHSGLVLSVLVLGMVISDLFEFESRKVEARNDFALEPPKGAIVISLLVAVYAAYVVFLPPGPLGDLI